MQPYRVGTVVHHADGSRIKYASEAIAHEIVENLKKEQGLTTEEQTKIKELDNVMADSNKRILEAINNKSDSVIIEDIINVEAIKVKQDWEQSIEQLVDEEIASFS
jgi:hypothetical protein